MRNIYFATKSSDIREIECKINIADIGMRYPEIAPIERERYRKLDKSRTKRNRANPTGSTAQIRMGGKGGY